MGIAEDQATFWNGPGADRWIAEQAARDALLGPFGDAAIAAAQPAPGESVLDVGCGCGTTTLAIADRVGPAGRVVGVDLSAPMIARARALAGDRANVTFVAADATAATFDGPPFDVVTSRFGVMFFADPAAAFARLRAAARPGARLALVCWRALAENPWARVPLDAAIGVLGPSAAPPSPGVPDAPGPFSFGDPARVRAILAAAGFDAVALRPFDHRTKYGETALDAAAALVKLGPAAPLLAKHDDAVRARTIALVQAEIAPFLKEDGVFVDGASWIVTARAP